MSLTTMYPAKNNSPATILTAELSSSGNTMTVEDPSVFPAAPNLAVLGNSDDAEIVLYTAISGNSMAIVRGQNGTTPGTWGVGTAAARNFTSQDHEAFRENILDLENRKANTADLGDLATLDAVSWGEVAGTLNNQTDLKNALNGKQNVLTFDSVPTASSTNPVTSGGVKSYVDSHDDFKVTGTVSSSGYTLTDSRINDEHWEVDWIQFTTRSRVMTDVNWSTDIVNHTVTLSATYSGSTNVVVNMHWVQ